MTDNEKAVLVHMLLSQREQITAALRMLTAGAQEQLQEKKEPLWFGAEETTEGEPA